MAELPMGVFDGIDAEQAERIKAELTRELRRTLTDEIGAEVRERVEQEVRAEARRDFERERLARAPSPEDRARFRAYVREVHLDALAQASVATDQLVASQRALTRSRDLSTPAMYLMTIALPLAASGLVAWLGGLTPLAFAAITAFVLAWLLLVYSTLRRHATLEATARAAQKVSSDYQVIAERAKAFRMVHAERLESAKELFELLESLRLDKERLDAATHLGLTEIERAREALAGRIEELAPRAERLSEPGARFDVEDGEDSVEGDELGHEADHDADRRAKARR